jgi:hypothetical protein
MAWLTSLLVILGDVDHFRRLVHQYVPFEILLGGEVRDFGQYQLG